MRDEGETKIAVQHMVDINGVLHGERLVETVFGKKPCVALRVDAALAGQRLNGIAGNEMDENEGDEREPDESGNDEADPGEDEAKHGAPLPAIFYAPTPSPTSPSRRSAAGPTLSAPGGGEGGGEVGVAKMIASLT
jgi:hypothetical protein